MAGSIKFRFLLFLRVMLVNDPMLDSIARIGGPQLLADVLEELHTGEMLERSRCEAEVMTWSQSTTRTCGGHDGLGTITSEVPAEIYFDWEGKEPGFWSSAADRQWFLNKNPQFKVKYQPKAQIAWKPALDRHGSLWIGNKYGAAA
jgi:hypothetical protein